MMTRSLLGLLLLHSVLAAQWGGELRLSLRSDPRTFDPALVDESSAETVRYLTGGVLIRMNRMTQKPQAELAESWKMLGNGRRLELVLRKGVVFSDGTPFTSADVAYTFNRLMNPAIVSPTADSFRSGTGRPEIRVTGTHSLAITFPAPVAAIERLLDQVAIQSERSPLKDRAVLGPFVVADYRPGATVLLRRNPNYWKSENGRRLPYLDSIRLNIVANRDLEMLKLRRGELHMCDTLDADAWQRLRGDKTLVTSDAGPTTDVEMFWMNQSGSSRIPAAKTEWFRSRAFRQAISHAINRADLVRIVYKGYARPAAGPLPPGNLWFNASLKPHSHDVTLSRKTLTDAGFRYRPDGRLTDAKGNAVEFSVVTNAGNKVRTQMASLIQQDLRQIGIEINIVPLDFPSLVERITKTMDYEGVLLGLVNVDSDPNGQMNVWLSSGASHAWNPLQRSPATQWEAEIDTLMRRQAAAADFKTRKLAFDKVQQIASIEVPIVYLTHRNALTAVAASFSHVTPVPLRPSLYWDVEHIRFQGEQNVRASAAR